MRAWYQTARATRASVARAANTRKATPVGCRRQERQKRTTRPTGRACVGQPPRNRSRSSPRAAADPYRRAGSFSRHFKQTASRSAETAGRRRRGGVGGARHHAFLNGQPGFPRKGQPAREQLEEDDTQGPDIRLACQGAALAQGLLRRHVQGSTRDLAGPAQGAILGQQPGQAEVGDARYRQGALVLRKRLHEDIARLQVTVEHSAGVDVFDDPGEVGQEEGGFAHRQGAPATEPLRQGGALNVGGGQVADGADLPDLVNRDEVGVIENGCRPGLAEKPLAQLRAEQHRRVRHLERHQPAEGLVLGQIDDAKSAAAECPPDREMAELRRRSSRRSRGCSLLSSRTGPQALHEFQEVPPGRAPRLRVPTAVALRDVGARCGLVGLAQWFGCIRHQERLVRIAHVLFPAAGASV